VWADFAGTIGKVVDSSGTGINGASLKEAIRRGQIVTVHRGTDGTHPTLVVEKVEDPADAGSSLTLDALKDVTAPASTAAGMFLGTTAVGAWGAVANPTAGLWPGKTRTSRPNQSDRLVEVWDGAAWAPTHYDSGWRDVSSMLLNGFTGVIHCRRVGNVVQWRTKYGGLDGSAAGDILVFLNPYQLGAGWQFDSGFGADRAVLFNSGVGAPAFGYLYQESWEVPSKKTASPWWALPQGTQWYIQEPSLIPTSLPGTLVTTAH
jgi:hypothetical protein